MERSEGENPGGAFDQLICQDANTEPENQESKRTCWRYRRPAAVSLGLLAIALFATDIGLGLHYKNLTDARSRLHDVDLIGAELSALEDAYQNVMQTIKDVQMELASEINQHQESNWEHEHQLKTRTAYEAQIKTLQGDVLTLKTYLTGLDDGCRLCPPGWIFMHSMCYYIQFTPYIGARSWITARNYCQIYGGDLATIDSKDKENSTVKLLNLYKGMDMWVMKGVWIGLVNKDKSWKWLDGRDLVEGYWDNNEPYGTDTCATVRPSENLFKAWSTRKCREDGKWICEKTPSF